MKVWYDDKKREWIELEKDSKRPDSIYLDGYLKTKLDLAKSLLKKQWDCPLLIDGVERGGKSTLGMTVGYYMSDTRLRAKDFATGLIDASQKIKYAPNGSILIIDEGSLVFSSKDAMMKGQKQLLKILDVVGQKNLTFIIILPSFFDLTKQIAVRRARFLLHVYVDKKYNRGRFSYYSFKKKRELYEEGRKHNGSYKVVAPNFFGRFSDFKPSWYNMYLNVKRKSLNEALDGNIEISKLDESRFKTQLMMEFKKNNPTISNKIIAKGFNIKERELYRRFKGGVALYDDNTGPVIDNNLIKSNKNTKEKGVNNERKS